MGSLAWGTCDNLEFCWTSKVLVTNRWVPKKQDVFLYPNTFV